MLRKAEICLIPDKIVSPCGDNFIWGISKNSPKHYRGETSLSLAKYFDSVIVPNGQHLYFTTDEEIKEPCWIIANTPSGDKLLHVENISDNPKYFDMRGGYALFRNICRKIVATTNPKLWNIKLSQLTGGYPLRTTTFESQSTIAKIDIPFIEAYIKAYNEGSPIKEVMLETEKDPTNKANWYEDVPSGKYWEDTPIEPSPDRLYTNSTRRPKLRSNGTVIIHPAKQKTYTRGEVISILAHLSTESGDKWSFLRWFNKHYPE